MGSNPATPTKNSSQEKLNGVELIQFVSAFLFVQNRPNYTLFWAQSETLGDCVKILIFAS